MKYKLYNHQKIQNDSVLKSLKENDHIIYSAPVGFGKENCMGHMIKDFLDNNKKVLVIAPFRTLLFQLENGFKEVNPLLMMGSIERGDASSGLVLSTPHTLNNRMKSNNKHFDDIDIIMIDEAHLNYTGMMKILTKKYWDTAKWIGFSGTPIKANGERINGWDKTITNYQIPDLIETGYLAEYEYLAPFEMDLKSLRVDSGTGDYNTSDINKLVSETSAIQSVVKAVDDYCKDKKTLIFAASIEHAKLIVNAIPEAMIIHSKISEKIQRETLKQFKDSIDGILVNVTMLTTGYNEPSIECLIIARPIKSIPKGIQVWGRSLRTYNNQKTTIIDLASVYKNVGLPNEVRDFDYIKPPKEVKNKDSFMSLACPCCKKVFNVATLKKNIIYTDDYVTTEFFCPECNSKFKETEKELTEIGKLKIIEEVERNKQVHWTKELVLEKALKYETRKEFIKKSSGAYDYARKNNILEEVCSHMKKYEDKWNKQKVIEEALKYKSRAEFIKKSSGAYKYAKRHNLLDKAYSHMRVVIQWNRRLASKEALKYETRREFVRKSHGAYHYARKNNILEEVCSHMKKPKRWTKQEVIEIASKYETKSEFRVKGGGAYNYAYRHNLFDNVLSFLK